MFDRLLGWYIYIFGGCCPLKAKFHYASWFEASSKLVADQLMEVRLGPGDFVLDGDSAPPSGKKRHAPRPIFGPCLLRPNGCMHQDTTWYGGRPQPRRHCVT